MVDAVVQKSVSKILRLLYNAKDLLSPHLHAYRLRWCNFQLEHALFHFAKKKCSMRIKRQLTSK